MYEVPAAPPAEMKGSTHMDEHHPLEHSDHRAGEAGNREKRQGRIMEQRKEVGDGEEFRPVSPEEQKGDASVYAEDWKDRFAGG